MAALQVYHGRTAQHHQCGELRVFLYGTPGICIFFAWHQVIMQQRFPDGRTSNIRRKYRKCTPYPSGRDGVTHTPLPRKPRSKAQ